MLHVNDIQNLTREQILSYINIYPYIIKIDEQIKRAVLKGKSTIDTRNYSHLICNRLRQHYRKMGFCAVTIDSFWNELFGVDSQYLAIRWD